MAPSLLAKFHFILTIDKYLRNFFILLQSSLTDIFKKAMSQYYINHKKRIMQRTTSVTLKQPKNSSDVIFDRQSLPHSEFARMINKQTLSLFTTIVMKMINTSNNHLIRHIPETILERLGMRLVMHVTSKSLKISTQQF